MKLQRINHAEAIIEPFFDGSDSDRPVNRVSALTHYRIRSSDPIAVHAEQSWCGIDVVMDGGAPAWIEMERDCDLDISDFNLMRFADVRPLDVRQTLCLQVDGQWQTLTELPMKAPGTERDFAITGRRLEKIRIRLEHDGTQDRRVMYKWIGLSHAAREAEMLAQKSQYPTDWPDMLLPQGGFTPTIGIYFDGEELEAIRKRVGEPLLKPLYQELVKEARSYLSWEPEKDIGECIPHPDGRWARARDMHMRDFHTPMQVLAFVGLVEKDAGMMRMAVRMALSAAHCHMWSEGSVMGMLDGTIWHHRAFTEQEYCQACALVLDWAGSWMTPHAQEVVLDAIIMKGLPRIESDFRRQEYIRSMNQGIVFSAGRVFALMACAHYYPRYRDQVLEAERDLYEMIDNYILPDGGTPEGPTYWNFTFHHAMPTLYVLSRFHGKPFRESLTDQLEKTGRHGLSQLSITGDGGRSIPVNDAGANHYQPLLMAAFYQLTGKEDYARLMALSLAADGNHSMDMFIMAPDRIPPVETYVQEGYVALPDLGQVRIIRRDEKQGRVNLHFYTGLADVGHYHMDKGSFVLETEHETLIMERGNKTYGDPNEAIGHMPESHNLLFPEFSGVRARQKASREGACLVCSSYENGRFEALGDITRAWADERIVKDTRRIESDDPCKYLIEDELILTEDAPASFLLYTAFPCEAEGNAVVVHGKHATVRIEPENWIAEASCQQQGEIWRIALRSGAKKEHHLRTRITIL